MSSANLAKVSQTGGFGKSTLITTTVFIPMPSGVKPPASEAGAAGRSSSGVTSQQKPNNR